MGVKRNCNGMKSISSRAFQLKRDESLALEDSILTIQRVYFSQLFDPRQVNFSCIVICVTDLFIRRVTQIFLCLMGVN